MSNLDVFSVRKIVYTARLMDSGDFVIGTLLNAYYNNLVIT